MMQTREGEKVTEVKDRSVIVLGAGMVGVCVALELQQRGAKVTLIDRKEPGRETSYGNLGVIARSSLVPMNNPALFGNLPKLLTNKTASLRYSVPFLLRNAGWLIGFLNQARMASFRQTAAALDGLIRLSYSAHRRLLGEAGALERLNDTGWLFAFRSDEGYAGTALSRKIFDEYDIATETLDRDGLRALEPGLKPVFSKALWIKDSASVNSPGAVVSAYAGLFSHRGGEIRRAEVRGLSESENGWIVSTTSGELPADQVVVALGPWARGFMENLGYAVPMAFERGYHMHFSGPVQGGTPLTRPVHDAACGYAMAPMEQGLRLTTGVELTDCDAPHNYAQLTLAESTAREAYDLGDRLDPEPWLGRRPSMPDSRPVIGPAPGKPGLFLAFGHQHIGFSTGPGTARLLADLMEGKPTEIPSDPFAPSRFIR